MKRASSLKVAAPARAKPNSPAALAMPGNCTSPRRRWMAKPTKRSCEILRQAAGVPAISPFDRQRASRHRARLSRSRASIRRNPRTRYSRIAWTSPAYRKRSAARSLTAGCSSITTSATRSPTRARLQTHRHVTRRWYYLIPADGEPRGLVHRIESGTCSTPARREAALFQLAGTACRLARSAGNETRRHAVFAALRRALCRDGGRRHRRTVRELGPEVVSSAELIQEFEACLNESTVRLARRSGRASSTTSAQAPSGSLPNAAAPASMNWPSSDWVRDEFRKAGPRYRQRPDRRRQRPCRRPALRTAARNQRRPSGRRPGAARHVGRSTSPAPFTTTSPGPASAATLRPHPQRLRNRARRPRCRHRGSPKPLRGREIRGFRGGRCRPRATSRRKASATSLSIAPGHSIGEEVHGTGANMDNLETHDDRRILPGALFSVEPGIYLPDFGIRSEVAHVAGVRGESVRISERNHGRNEPSAPPAISFADCLCAARLPAPDRRFELNHFRSSSTIPRFRKLREV
jgi:Xaa-Pro dipeptidase